MTTPNKLNEFHRAEDPARQLLERLGWTYVPRDALVAERGGEREVLLDGILRSALLRLNEWLTEVQADRVIFELENINATGMARNQAVHEYLTFGMPLNVDGPRGRDSRTVRFFDFDHPEGGLNEFVVTTQFRVRRGNERAGLEDDERLVIPDLVLFVNGIPLVVMEGQVAVPDGRLEDQGCSAAASLSRSRAGVARPGEPRSSSTTTCCVWPTAGPPRPTPRCTLRRTPTSSGSRWCPTRTTR